MNLKANEIVLLIVVLMIFALYGLALIYNFNTNKPIPDELSYFVRISMGAAGVAITRLLISVGKDDKIDGNSNDSSDSDGH